MKLLLSIGGTAALAAAGIQALRIGYADYLYRKDTLRSVQRAAGIWSSADFYARLADLDARNAITYLRRAVALDPGHSKSWIQLGLRLELNGEAEEAERCYLEAAGRDRQFLPAWTLANYYARRHDAARFWPWARHAVQMSYDDIRPLLRLAFGFTASPEVVLNQMVVPRRKVEHEFLYYLISEKMDASAIAARLQSKAGMEDLPPLLAWTDRLIATRRVAEARDVWNALSDRRLLPYPRVALLTNANFSREPLQAGFDWRLNWPQGVSGIRSGGGLRIEFSGRQPKTFELASQYLPVTSGTYVLSFEYRSTSAAATNLRWCLEEAACSEPLPATEDWKHSAWTFTAGPLNRLVLLERRDPGSTRPEGVVYLKDLHLTTSPLDGEPHV
jgi:tetratricopeptide (TPR) repeat protein